MVKSELHQIQISLPEHSYPIYVGNGCLSDAQLLQRHVLSRQLLIVSNQTVADHYLKFLLSTFHGYQCDVVLLPDGEEHKTAESLFKIYNALMDHSHHRDTTIIALGGGVIGDIAGFAASTYQRGVRFIQIPTTLLAQVDSSVGGKTAINFRHGKNLIGSFYQPMAVIMDSSTLQTMPMREISAGMAEVIKYAFLAGNAFLASVSELFRQHGIATLQKKPEKLIPLIAECCRVKAEYVQKDEHELGQRALLNLGHTFGHALEAYTDYKRWRHGEAVGIGLYCAALLSYQLGWLAKHHLQQLDELLAQANLPRRIPKTIDLNRLHGLMWKDKKVRNQRMRLVLIKKPGECVLNDAVSEACLLHALSSAVEGE